MTKCPGTEARRHQQMPYARSVPVGFRRRVRIGRSPPREQHSPSIHEFLPLLSLKIRIPNPVNLLLPARSRPPRRITSAEEELGGGSLLFWTFAILTLTGGIGVVIARNPVNGAMALVGSFFALAGLFLLLDAQLIAALQVLVYAGAIMVALFLFVISVLLNLGPR